MRRAGSRPWKWIATHAVAIAVGVVLASLGQWAAIGCDRRLQARDVRVQLSGEVQSNQVVLRGLEVADIRCNRLLRDFHRIAQVGVPPHEGRPLFDTDIHDQAGPRLHLLGTAFTAAVTAYYEGLASLEDVRLECLEGTAVISLCGVGTASVDSFYVASFIPVCTRIRALGDDVLRQLGASVQ